MDRTPTRQRIVSFVASFFATLALFEAIADHARVDAGLMIMVQAAPAVL